MPEGRKYILFHLILHLDKGSVINDVMQVSFCPSSPIVMLFYIETFYIQSSQNQKAMTSFMSDLLQVNSFKLRSWIGLDLKSSYKFPFFNAIFALSLDRKKVFAYIKSAFEFSLVPHLDVDPLVQAQPDKIKGFLDRGRSSLQDVFIIYSTSKLR